MLLQKSVAGTVTTVSTGPVLQGAYATTRARVVAQGTSITAYYQTSTQLYSGVQVDLATNTQHGIGRGSGQSYNSSSIDDLNLAWK
jgi:hypothetical protein